MAKDSAPDLSGNIAALIGEKLGVRGTDLDAQISRAGRRLPAGARAAALELAEAERLAAHPRLARRLDPDRLARAHARAARELASIDPAERRVTAVLRLLGTIAFNLLLLTALVIALLRWRGLL